MIIRLTCVLECVMTWLLHSCWHRLEQHVSESSCSTSGSHSTCTWTVSWFPLADEDCNIRCGDQALSETHWQQWMQAQGACKYRHVEHTWHERHLYMKAFHSEYTHHNHWVDRCCTAIDDAKPVLCTHTYNATQTYIHLYIHFIHKHYTAGTYNTHSHARMYACTVACNACTQTLDNHALYPGFILARVVRVKNERYR